MNPRKTYYLCLVLFLIFPMMNLHAETMTLKILTINVWSGLNYEGVWKMGEYETREHRDKRYQVLVEQLKSVQPDVICLQEVNPVPEYARRLAYDIGYQGFAYVGMGGIHVGPIGIPINFREGDAILVKPGLEAKSLGRTILSGAGISNNWITFHFSEITQVMGVHVQKNGWQINIFSTHLHAGPGLDSNTVGMLREQWESGNLNNEEFASISEQFARNAQRRYHEATGLVQFVENHLNDSTYTLVAGDFNTEKGSPEYQLLSDAGFVDSFTKSPFEPSFTWAPNRNLNIQKYYGSEPNDHSMEEYFAWKHDHQPRRIDYIWVSNLQKLPWEIKSASLFGTQSKNGVNLSDHFGYMIEIELSR